MSPQFLRYSPDDPQSSQHHLPRPRSLTLPDGFIDAEPANLLEGVVHSQHEEVDFDAGYRARKVYNKNLPWYKVPTPWWLLAISPLTTIAFYATIAPKIEVYTLMACSVHQPNNLRWLIPKHGHSFDTSRNLSETAPQVKLSDGFSTQLALILRSNKETEVPKNQMTACTSDPIVQAAVAKLSTAITTSTGILSCLTTGWWSSFSDRRGRTRLLGISVLGVINTDLSFVFVSRNFKRLPGGYWWFILGPLLDGLLGGVSTSTATVHAYIADTTAEGLRSRNLSLGLGLLAAGMAVGPALGGLLISVTGNLLSVFYAAALMNIIYAFFVWFILPESLLETQMQQSKAKYDEENHSMQSAVGIFAALPTLSMVLRPLSVFLPALSAGNYMNQRRDWNLTILAIVYGLTGSLMGLDAYKLQYAAATFGWSSKMLGYFLTSAGIVRAVFLVVALPCIIKLFKSKPLGSAPTILEGDYNTQAPPGRVSRAASSSFDLGIARISMLVDTGAHIFRANATTALVFTTSTMAVSMAAGLSPAAQSIALALYRRRGGTEFGKLFGALGVVDALSSQVFGPAVYGLLYVNTVGTFPKAIFILSATTATAAFVLLMFLRLPQARGFSENQDPSVGDDRAEAPIHIG